MSNQPALGQSRHKREVLHVQTLVVKLGPWDPTDVSHSPWETFHLSSLPLQAVPSIVTSKTHCHPPSTSHAHTHHHATTHTLPCAATHQAPGFPGQGRASGPSSRRTSSPCSSPQTRVCNQQSPPCTWCHTQDSKSSWGPLPTLLTQLSEVNPRQPFGQTEDRAPTQCKQLSLTWTCAEPLMPGTCTGPWPQRTEWTFTPEWTILV